MTGLGNETLYVFVDESGNFDFSGTGTDHFLISAFLTSDPLASAAAMTELRYQLLSEGHENVEFHASQNSQAIRNRVTSVICSLEKVAVYTLYANKHYASPKIHSPAVFLGIFAKALARGLAQMISPRFGTIIIVFDSALTGRQQSVFLKELKGALKPLGRKYHISFLPVKSDLNGQIADYFAWSEFRALESGDVRARTDLKNIYHKKFNIFRNGHTRYW